MSSLSKTEFPGTDRFEVIRRIGAGGMGVVYEAFDRARSARVALKFLPTADPLALYRFKQEFRALADVSHRNLVSLYELFAEQSQWFFTMELVHGSDFLTYVRGPRTSSGELEPTGSFISRDTGEEHTPTASGVHSFGVPSVELTDEVIARLRSALRQLVEGVRVLHHADILHRDIKPSNVLVTAEGRVVLLDFGLASKLKQPRSGPATDYSISGTAAYMSPEQAAGQPLTQASDWYGVGVMLYQVLTGRSPFAGLAQDVMRAKQESDPPAPTVLVPGVPSDLSDLCVALLKRPPSARPDAAEILQLCTPLGACAGVDTEGAGLSRTSPAEFVGRRQQLSELLLAYARVRAGRTAVVFVRGESGAGKSALIHRFLEELPRDPEPVVLAGRCYEQESVPLKAFDSLIDTLTRYLDALPAVEAEAVLPRHVAALARIFPVVDRVSVIANAPARRVEVPDQRELRRRAFAALRELLARIGDRRPLILLIDDLQWGDVDSANLLTELVQLPDPPLLLLLATYRTEDVNRSACLRLLLGSGGAGEAAVAHTSISLLPLTKEEGLELAVGLLGRDHPAAVAEAEQIVRESQGSPYFVCELAQLVREGILRSPNAGAIEPAAPGSTSLQLDDALWQRIERLPADVRAVLEVLSVASRPLRPGDTFAVAACREPLGAIARLRTDRFIRVTGTDADEVLAPYHDRIRETILARLTPTVLRTHHRDLARILQAGATPDPQTLAIHFEGAGEAEVAGRYYAAAADDAGRALAFDHAAELYRKAMALRPVTDGERWRMLRKLADALANSGRGVDAARQYLAAAADAPEEEALTLRGLAGFQYCAAGDIDAGRQALADVLERLGIRLPRTRGRALCSLLWNRLRLWWRGIRFRERREEEVPAAELARVDVTWSVAVGLTMIDTIRGADFQTRNLLLALRTGEPYRIARSLAWEATHVAMGGVGGRKRTRQMLEASGQLAERLGRVHAAGMTMMGRGVSAFFLGDWREAFTVCDQAVAIFTERCTGVAWELDTSNAFAFWSLFWLGRFGEIQNRFPRLVGEAQQRGDRLAEANFTTFGGPFVFLARDDPEAAAQALSGVMGAWSRQDFHVQHFTTLSAHTYIDLYRGRAGAAWENLLRQWPALKASFLLQVECVRIFMLHLRASCALAAAEALRAAGAKADALERAAARDARRLERERPEWCRPLALMIRATLAARAGDRAGATAGLAAAIVQLESHDMDIYAAAARLRHGELLGGTSGDELTRQAADRMRLENILCPERMAGLFAPGFPVTNLQAKHHS